VIVQKYGGATLADPQKIRQTATRIKRDLLEHQHILIVVSAMGATTNELIQLAHQVATKPHLRELDMLLTTGERVSASLLTMALIDLGIPAISLTGSQAGIITDEHHSQAHILNIRPERIEKHLSHFPVVVIAGFQGVSSQGKNVTTLGRGGSDLSAVALAHSLNAKACYILKDVDSVYTADPRKVPNAHKVSELSASTMSRMSFWGAKVIHWRAAKLAEHCGLPLYVGPAHAESHRGTWIRSVGDSTHSQYSKSEARMNYEQARFIAVTSFEKVLAIKLPSPVFGDSPATFLEWAKQEQVPEVLILELEQEDPQHITLYVTGPKETWDDLTQGIQSQKGNSLILSVVSVHAYPMSSSELRHRFFSALSEMPWPFHKVTFSDEAFHIWLSPQHHDTALNDFHQKLIDKPIHKEPR
jgi:aspartate kinase